MDEARRQFDVNVFGLARLTQLVLPHMRSRRSGRIINISSMGGKIYEPLGSWYHATKFAVEGLSDSLRLELAPFGVDVVVVEPGAIKTEWAGISGANLSSARPTARTPGRPAAVAAAFDAAYGDRPRARTRASSPTRSPQPSPPAAPTRYVVGLVPDRCCWPVACCPIAASTA